MNQNKPAVVSKYLRTKYLSSYILKFWQKRLELEIENASG